MQLQAQIRLHLRNAFTDKQLFLFSYTLSLRILIQSLAQSLPDKTLTRLFNIRKGSAQHTPKLMVSVWWSSADVVHYDFMKPGPSITAEVFRNQVDKMMRGPAVVGSIITAGRNDNITSTDCALKCKFFEVTHRIHLFMHTHVYLSSHCQGFSVNEKQHLND
uniref:Uncharacterized protein n=1 Tax=Glossina pallidipes TaxID=7398 RepID=A0A1A9Z2U2_GLOPL